MNNLRIQEQKPGRFVIDGNLTFSTINKNSVKSLSLPKSAQHVIFDLKGVTTTDSAGLALIIEWIKFARDRNIQLLFDNIPDQLLSIARLSGVEEMIRPEKQ